MYALASDANQYNLRAVFRSTDGGGTWTAQVRNNNTTKLNTVLLSNPLAAFLSECGQGRSFLTSQGWYDNVIAVDPVNENRVWVGGVDLFRSDDGGANWGLASYWWAEKNEPGYAHADQHAIVFHPNYNGTTNKTMYVGNDGGVFRTDDATAMVATGIGSPCSPANTKVVWQSLNNNYGVTQFYFGLPFPNGSSYFGGTQDNGTLLGSDATGINGWHEILGGDGGYVAVDPANPQTLYAETTYLSLRKSTDGGKTFGRVTFGIDDPSNSFPFITPFAMDPSDGQRLWIGGVSVYRTTNGAANWTKASLPLNSGQVSALAVAATNANHVAMGTSAGRIFLTDTALTANENTTWLSTAPRTGYVSSVAFDPANPLLVYATYSTFGGTHIWRSTDFGLSWSPLDGFGETGIPDIPVHTIAIDPNDPARLYVGTDLGVFVSTNGGVTWAVENTGFANVVTESLALQVKDGLTTLYAFTHGRGAFRVVVNDRGCNYALTTSSKTVGQEGGSGTVNITGASAGCSWQASSNNSWITITTTTANSISYSVAANEQLLPRVGTIAMGGRCFTITQPGSLDKEDNAAPIITILSPTTASSYDSPTPRLTLSGTATDDSGIAQITWANERRALSGTAAGTSKWAISEIPLESGLNRITITARDVRGRTSQALLQVLFRQGPVIVTVSTLGATAMAPDKDGNLYLLGPIYKAVAKLDSKTGTLTRYAGGGDSSDAVLPALQAAFLTPTGVAVDQAGNLFITDAENQRLYKVTPGGQLTTLAGALRVGGFQGDNGPAANAVLNWPLAVAVDQAGNIYIADANNYRIRKIRAADGVITTIAGNGTNGKAGNGGPAVDAQITTVYSLATDKQGNVYFADYNDHSIRKITAATGLIQRVAGTGVAGFNGNGGPAQDAQLTNPRCVWIDANDNLWIADSARISKVDAQTGIFQVVAGGGTAGAIDGAYAPGVALAATTALITDDNGFPLFSEAGKLRKVVPFSLADFPRPSLQLLSPATAEIVTSDAYLYVSGRVENLINVTHASWANDRGERGYLSFNAQALTWANSIPLSPGVNNLTFTVWDLLGRTSQAKLKVTANVSTITKPIAGTMSAGFSSKIEQAVQAPLWSPEGLAMDSAGNLYIADTGNHRIRKITPTGIISTVAGTGNVGNGEGGKATETNLNGPRGVALDSEGNLYIADTNNHRICRVGADGILRLIAGSGESSFSGDGGSALAAKLNEPVSLTITAGNLYFVDTKNYRVRKVDLQTGLISTYAGNLPGKTGDGILATDAYLGQPYGLAINKAGNLFISDSQNNRIYRVTSDGKLNTYASSYSGGINVDIYSPKGLAIDRNDNLYVVPQSQNTVRKITPQGTVTGMTFFTPSFVKFETGNASTLRNPSGLAVDRAGNVYVADTGNHRIIAAINYQQAVSVSTASYDGSVSASEAIVSVFGAALANTTQAASSQPLPTSLGGTSVLVRDSGGVERPAPLFYVSPLQVNYQVPAGTAPGPAVVTVISGDNMISSGVLLLQSVSPGLFAANADGSGAAALGLLRIKADGARAYESAIQLNAAKTRWVPLPIDVSVSGDEVFLELYGTGIRGWKEPVRAFIGGEAVPVLYAGAAPGFVGLDQVNVSLPRYLLGRGEIDIQLFVDGSATNPVKINVAGTACAATLSATSQTVSSAGGNGAVNLTTGNNCNWAAQSQASWLTLTASAQGSGNAAITYVVAPNPSLYSRTGTLRIAGQTVTVTQAGFTVADAPVISFTAPTTAVSYETISSLLTLRGAIATKAGVVWLIWNINGGSHTVLNAAPNFLIPDIAVRPGSNVITVTAYDHAGRAGTTTLTVNYNALSISTVAGGGTKTPADGVLVKEAALTWAGYAFDHEGALYLSEADRLYKVNAGGALTTVATDERLRTAGRFLFDRNRNLYFTSGFRSNVYRLNLATGEVTDFGLTLRPQFFDSAGNLYLSGNDFSNSGWIYKFNPDTRQYAIIGGNGSYYNATDPTDYGDGKLLSEVRFSQIDSITLDREGNLYFAEGGYRRIRKVDARTNIVTTFVGAPGSSRIEPTYALTAESFGNLHFDTTRNQLYFTSHYGLIGSNPTARIYQLDFTTGTLSAIATAVNRTQDDAGRSASEMTTIPSGLKTDTNGVLHYSDNTNKRVKKLTRVP